MFMARNPTLWGADWGKLYFGIPNASVRFANTSSSVPGQDRQGSTADSG